MISKFEPVKNIITEVTLYVIQILYIVCVCVHYYPFVYKYNIFPYNTLACVPFLTWSKLNELKMLLQRQEYEMRTISNMIKGMRKWGEWRKMHTVVFVTQWSLKLNFVLYAWMCIDVSLTYITYSYLDEKLVMASGKICNEMMANKY